MKHRVFTATFSVLLVIFGQSASCLADPGNGPSTAAPSVLPNVDISTEIPSKPNPPPPLFKRAPPEGFRCERTYLYDGKSYGCDSNVRRDGEGLRPLFQDVPASVSSLNAYQNRRSALQITAYFGSVGLLALLAGAVMGAGSGKQLLLLSGTGILGGSFLYGFTSLRANEAKLDEAVQLHNQAKPDKPVQLQFSTGIAF